MSFVGPRALVRLVIFWAAFCFAVMIADIIFRGAGKAMAFSWPQAIIALALAVLTQFVILPRLPADGATR